MSKGNHPDRAGAKAWDKASLSELADHIVATHHRLVRKQMGKLVASLDRVVREPGPRGMDMCELEALYTDFESQMVFHMLKEEQMLFPTIKHLEHKKAKPVDSRASLKEMVQILEREHRRADSAMARMHKLTSGFTVPPDASAHYKAVMESLAHMEADMKEHVQKEDQLLFPRAIELEAKVAKAE